MVVERIQSNLIAQRANQHVLRLQDGQIVEGKIIKLYADQHAQINISSTSLVAQIETALSVGKSYYFQVHDMDGDIYLKVLHDSKGKAGTQNIEALMNQLQVKVTNQNHAFVEQLIKNGIPFQRQQLLDAIQLLDTSTNKTIATNVIQSMLQQKLPLTQAVFQALNAFETKDFSTLLQNAYAEIQKNASVSAKVSETMIMKQLETIISMPMRLEVQASQLMHNGIKEHHSVFVLSQLLGLVDTSGKAAETMQQLQRFMQSQSADHYPLTSIETKDQLRQVFQQAQQHIDHIITNEAAIRKVVMKLRSIFHPLKTSTLQSNDIASLSKMMQTELHPLLPKEVSMHLHTLLAQMTENNQTIVWQYLQALMDDSGYDFLKNMHTLIQYAPWQGRENLSVQQQFMSHLSNVSQTLGLNIEHELVQALQLEPQQREEVLLQQSQTIKSLLLHVLQQGGSSQENVQQLVHFINGLQLQSYTESNQISQAQFLIPGNKLSLNKDMFIQFESKKQQDGTIDTDYCRIFFVLDLERLRETMIDMHIQKRIISITIYNDHLSGDNKMQAIQKGLSDNLATLQYQLSAIQWKPLYEKQHAESTLNPVEVNQAEERYDFRI